MRVAYLTGEYPRTTDTFIQREVFALREMGIDVHTFSIRRTGDEHMVGEEQKQERDRTSYILPANPLELLFAHLNLFLNSPQKYLQTIKLACSTSQPGFKGGLYQLFYFLEAGILARRVKASRLSHLHNHFGEASCTVAMLAAQMGGFTYSFTLHGSYIFFKAYQWRLDEKIKRALFVACISYFARSQGMIFADPEHWSDMHVVHCGIDPDVFQPVTHREDGKRLLFVGRLSAVKGLPLLLESVAQLRRKYPDISLTLVGDGSDRHKLQALTDQLGLSQNVHFVGSKSQSEVREYLQQADIFVMASFAEGIPVVLMEAMACGLPVVATQVGGISELVENGISGYLVPPGDSIHLQKQIEKLLDDYQTRVIFGTEGRKKIEKDFNIRYEVNYLYQLMKNTLQDQEGCLTGNSLIGNSLIDNNLTGNKEEKTVISKEVVSLPAHFYTDT